MEMVNDNDIELMHYTYLTMQHVLNEESVVSNFIRDLLKAIGYEKRDSRTLWTHREIPMYIYMEKRNTTMDVCLLNAGNGITVVIQEHKWHIDGTNKPEPQLITEAITSFLYNDSIHKVVIGRTIQDQQVIYGIIMYATTSAFYEISIRKKLVDAVMQGEYPDALMKVTMHIPQGPHPSCHSNEGMLKFDVYLLLFLKL